MRILKRLANIDRRVIYSLVLVVVILPLIWRSSPKVEISPEVQQAYGSIDSVRPQGVIMISVDYDGASEAECQPMLMALLRHCFARNLRVLMVVQWPLGLSLGQIALDSAAAEFGKVYGRDYVNLGYRPGTTALIVGIGKEGFRRYFARDFRGVPIDQFPLMQDIQNYSQIDRLVGLEAGAMGDLWVMYAGAQFGVRIILGVTGVMATSMYPYLQARQIEGLIGGLRGAAEYEALVNHPHRATWGMNSQSLLHILIILLVILGNVTFRLTERAKGRPVQTQQPASEPSPSPEPRPQSDRSDTARGDSQ